MDSFRVSGPAQKWIIQFLHPGFAPVLFCKKMNSFAEKCKVILDHEQQFAFMLAKRGLDKPKLAIWMFPPPIFVYYMNDFKKFKDGRNAFAAHYMTTQKRALEEAEAMVFAGIFNFIGRSLFYSRPMPPCP